MLALVQRQARDVWRGRALLWTWTGSELGPPPHWNSDHRTKHTGFLSQTAADSCQFGPFQLRLYWLYFSAHRDKHLPQTCSSLEDLKVIVSCTKVSPTCVRWMNLCVKAHAAKRLALDLKTEVWSLLITHVLPAEDDSQMSAELLFRWV